MSAPIGIGAYACAFPAGRLAAAELARALGAAPAGLESRPVAGPDEDALTLAIEAALGVVSPEVGCLAVASTTLPYERRVQVGLVAAALGLAGSCFASEHGGSPRAGTEALVLQRALLAAGRPGAGIVVAAEAPEPAGEVDPGAGAGAVAIRLEPGGRVATFEDAASYVAEFPGLKFSRPGEGRLRDIEVPDYAARACEEVVQGAVRPLLGRLGRELTAYRFLVLTTPDPRLQRAAVRALRAADAQWRPASTFARTGDLGAAAPLAGLAAALDRAAPGDRLLVIGYGSGSAADAVSLVAGPGAGGGVYARAIEGGQPMEWVAAWRAGRGR